MDGANKEMKAVAASLAEEPSSVTNVAAVLQKYGGWRTVIQSGAFGIVFRSVAVCSGVSGGVGAGGTGGLGGGGRWGRSRAGAGAGAGG